MTVLLIGLVEGHQVPSHDRLLQGLRPDATHMRVQYKHPIVLKYVVLPELLLPQSGQLHVLPNHSGVDLGLPGVIQWPTLGYLGPGFGVEVGVV